MSRAEGAGDAPLLDRLFAVVVNWNGGARNEACLASLIEREALPAEHVVFVDNGSSDGSLAAVRARFPRVVVIENGENLGFGEGANRGLARALALGARAVAFINNDLTLPGGTLARLARELDADPRAGIVGPLVLCDGEPDRVWCAGGRLDHRANLSTLLGYGEAPERWRRSSDVDYVAGCALVARAELLAELGGFDASYFAYHEDLELCLRARRRGWRVRTIGEVTARHAPSSATGGGYNARRKWMMGLNSVRFLRRYGTPATWARFVVFDVLTLPPALLLGLATGRWRGVLAKGAGIADGLAGKQVTAARLERGASRLWR